MSKGGRRDSINVENIRAFRARGKTWEEISRATGHSKSGLWRAVNQPDRKAVEVPAGRPRTVYLPDGAWECLAGWARERGTTRSRVLGALVVQEAEFQAAQLSHE